MRHPIDHSRNQVPARIQVYQGRIDYPIPARIQGGRGAFRRFNREGASKDPPLAVIPGPYGLGDCSSLLLVAKKQQEKVTAYPKARNTKGDQDSVLIGLLGRENNMRSSLQILLFGLAAWM